MKQNKAPLFLTHTLEPIYFPDSKVLILGSFPSPKSRESGFYYGHPYNRFWNVLSLVFEEPQPRTIPEKTEFLFQHHIALWDVLASCIITGADDNSIKDPKPNDIARLLKNTQISAVFTTGLTAYKLYQSLLANHIGIDAVRLYSTSPANCRMNINELVANYVSIKNVLDQI